MLSKALAKKRKTGNLIAMRNYLGCWEYPFSQYSLNFSPILQYLLPFWGTEKTKNLARNREKTVKIIIRAVDTDLKGLSMGMFWLVVKLFGSLPSPVLLGGFLDWACLGNGFSYTFMGSCFFNIISAVQVFFYFEITLLSLAGEL